MTDAPENEAPEAPDTTPMLFEAFVTIPRPEGGTIKPGQRFVAPANDVRVKNNRARLIGPADGAAAEVPGPDVAEALAAVSGDESAEAPDVAPEPDEADTGDESAPSDEPEPTAPAPAAAPAKKAAGPAKKAPTPANP